MATANQPAEDKAGTLQAYSPTLTLSRLVAGIDNIRFDVHLSPRWRELASRVLFEQILHHARHQLRQIYSVDVKARTANLNEFKRRLGKLLLESLAQAKAQSNIEIDLLARVALYRWLVAELRHQFSDVVVACKERIEKRGYQHDSMQIFTLQSRLSEFQAGRRHILRAVGELLYQVFEELEEKRLQPERTALFGTDFSHLYRIVRSRLVFLENPQDSITHLEHYVLLGHREDEADHEGRVKVVLEELLREQGAPLPEAKEVERLEQQRAGLAADLQQQVQRRRELDSQLEVLAAPEKRKGFSLKWFSGREAVPEDPEALQQELEQEVHSLQARQQQTGRHLEELQQKIEFTRQSHDVRLEEILSHAPNAGRLFGPAPAGGAAVERTPEQRALLRELFNRFEKRDMLRSLLASYKLKPVYREFCPPFSPHQLKPALAGKDSLKELQAVLKQFPARNFPLEKLGEIAEDLRRVRFEDAEDLLAQFASDFMRLRCDLLHLRLMQALMEKIHLVADDRSRAVSRMNHTLYEFVLAEERQSDEERVLNHVVVKADIRDSTGITEDLVQRGLNPATHFSLNFFEPVRKLIARYNAVKIFVEGDAMILGIFETDSTRIAQRPVAKACLLAKEIIQVAQVYNRRAMANDLPVLELGLGVAFQEGGPHYWSDGATRVMISPAINHADRLSGCSKAGRRLMEDGAGGFSCFLFEGPATVYSGEDKEGQLIRYNVMGVVLDEAGFQRLEQEISLKSVETSLRVLGQLQRQRLYWGTVPIGESFEKIILREAYVPRLDLTDPINPQISGWNDVPYYEVCVNAKLYENFPAKSKKK